MSNLILSDDEIRRLLRLPKRVVNEGARWKEVRGSRQRNYGVESHDGEHTFKLYLRQNMRIQQSFSCGLVYVHPSREEVTLTRYNGPDHPHSNPLELGERLNWQCHIHIATSRYMSVGRKPEHYATPTDRYSDLDGAFLALLGDCNIDGFRRAQTNDPTPDLFK